MQMLEFLASDLTYLLPAPGGSIAHGRETTSCDGDAYLAAIAAHMKSKSMEPEDAVQFLYMKMGHLANQEHFGAEQDVLIIKRLGDWIREFVVRH